LRLLLVCGNPTLADLGSRDEGKVSAMSPSWASGATANPAIACPTRRCAQVAAGRNSYLDLLSHLDLL